MPIQWNLLITLSLLTSAVFAQSISAPTTITVTGGLVAKDATRTAPVRVAAGAPTAINGTTGDFYFQSDATAGQNVWICPATATPCIWSQITGGGGTYTAGTGLQLTSTVFSTDPAVTPSYSSGTGAAPGTCAVGAFYAKTNTNRGYLCTSTNTQTQIGGPTLLDSGTSITLSAPREYAVCTSTCTVTVPVPAAGYEFCVRNANAATTQITLSALGSSAMYEHTDRSVYGTAGSGTMKSGGSALDQVCIVGLDATHYLTMSFGGSWTVN